MAIRFKSDSKLGESRLIGKTQKRADQTWARRRTKGEREGVDGKWELGVRERRGNHSRAEGENGQRSTVGKKS